MKKSEIRPRAIYIGNGGLSRKVKSTQMNVAGELSVTWKAVSVPRWFDGTTWACDPIDAFAKLAKAIKETLSAIRSIA